MFTLGQGILGNPDYDQIDLFTTTSFLALE